MSLVVDEHRQYIADQARVSAFARALAETVRPGAVVLDLASGTGILGLLACQAGAGRVYCVEKDSIIELARDIGRANGFGDRMYFVKGLSTRVELPEQVDVVVTDQIGRFGFELQLERYLGDVRERCLAPGGVVIPKRIDLYIVPVERPDMWEQVEFWNRSPAGFDFRPARAIAANTGYPTNLQVDELLSEPAGLTSFEPASNVEGQLAGSAAFTVERSGVLHGVGGWFVAQLSEHVSMTNSPLAADRIGRRNVFFPIDRPVEVQRGHQIQVEMRIRPKEISVTWTVEVVDAAGDRVARFRHSTLNGMLIAREDLRMTQPAFVPALSPAGEARRSILELCDGARSLDEIEQEVYRRHPKLFRSAGDAAAFVAEVVTRYAD